MAGYAKLWASILFSTVWQEPDHVRIIWVTLLVMADKRGYVAASVPGLAKVAGEPLDLTIAALDRLAAPDLYSRTPDNEGRRIEAVAGGWRIMNFDHYRAMISEEDERVKAKVRKANERDRKRLQTLEAHLDGVAPPVTDVTDVTASHASSRKVTPSLMLYGDGVVLSSFDLPEQKEKSSNSTPTDIAVTDVTDSHVPAQEQGQEPTKDVPNSNRPLTPGRVGGLWNQEMKRVGQESYCIPGPKLTEEVCRTLKLLLEDPKYKDDIRDAIRYLGTETWWTNKARYPRFGFSAILKVEKVAEYAATFRSRSGGDASLGARTRLSSGIPAPPLAPANEPPAALSDAQAAAWGEFLAICGGLPLGKLKPKSDRELFAKIVQVVPADVLLARWRHVVESANEPRFAPKFRKWIDDDCHTVPCPGQPGYMAPKCKTKTTRARARDTDAWLDQQAPAAPPPEPVNIADLLK